MDFAKRLKILREEKKLSQRELAKLMNMAPSTLAMYEVGKREPNYEMLNRIADFFSVTTDYLLGRSPLRQLSINDLDIESIELRKGYNAEEISPDRVKEIAKAISNLQKDIDEIKKNLSKRVNN
ncbi:MAG: helix-turn-helix transcriptional regulator [Actinobacteria bacterium]|nr:helix-turn-helix transcriptional regulator [Actinomycetota bacterium]